jgi:protein-disulfide isomerase
MRAGIAATMIALVLIAGGCASRQLGGERRAAHATAAGAAVEALLAGIPEQGTTLGSPAAPVTLVYFGDLQCPFCREFQLGALRPLIATYVRSGKLKIEYRSLQTATRDRATFKTQQLAALAAGRQNRLWPYIELFYLEQGKENTGYVNERYLEGLAQQVSGLNLIAWSAARTDPTLAKVIGVDAHVAAHVGFNATPSFLIGDSNGRYHPFNPPTLTSALPYAAVTEELLRLGRRRRLGSPLASSA